ncbi:DUF692 domain-containing protein [Arenibacter latericius]|uniref:DUF692 domain-containing protein n=1 Tax=Arenibacter latericius TaxID=86104 RepID=UPI000402992A|nr:DUF692 family multinuclear iron-containing protein [Arenibacter latericius]MDX1363374.1 DUF692 family protein [Arenibacter latericius]
MVTSGKASQLKCLPQLGVGIIYSPSVERIEFPKGLIDTFEIEPQTLCLRNKFNRLVIPNQVFENIAATPYHKLVHSIGAPVGGSLPPAKDQLNLIQYATDIFDSPWITEHLSFNAVTEFNTGFFLPPLQTEKGLKQAIANITCLQNSLNKPIAIETGVNYLCPNNREMDDGQFVSKLCEATGCGILLDIHNLFANHLNGRQSISKFLKQINLEYVVEMHIAGGTELNGLWMDSHSGPIDKRLLAITREILPDLYNLKEITYEIFDSYIPVVGDSIIIQEMEGVRKLWDDRNTSYKIPNSERIPDAVCAVQKLNQELDPLQWENILGSLVIGRNIETPGFGNTSRIETYQYLIREFRASMVARVFKLTTRYMMLIIGKKAFAILLQDFWNGCPPEQLSYKEALNFADYLFEKNFKLPWLNRLLTYEVALLKTLMDNEIRIVDFDADPTPMFNALSQGKLPTAIGDMGHYEVEILPDKDKTQWLVI